MAQVHEDVARKWCEAWEGSPDAKTVAAFHSVDGEFYGNHNWPPHVGRDRIEQWWTQMLGTLVGVRIDILHVASQDNTVFVERIDTAIRDGGRWYLPIIGVCEVDTDGKISSWRDYFPQSDPADTEYRPNGAHGSLGKSKPSASPPKNQRESVVAEFFAAWEGVPDSRRLAGYMATDAKFYGNRNRLPHLGREAIQTWWEDPFFSSLRDIHVDMLHLASVGNTVFTERIDNFTIGTTGEQVRLHLAGAGEVDDDGKITNWRDYFATTPPPEVLP